MALIQGGPPEWIWERTPDPLKWDLVPSQGSEGQPVYELKVNCGLEIIRLQFFTEDEISQLRVLIDERLAQGPAGFRTEGEPARSSSAEPVPPGKGPGGRPNTPEAGRPPRREEGVVSDPDFADVH